MLVARTEPKERMDRDVGSWWKEFQIRKAEGQFILEKRRINEGEPPEAWVQWASGPTRDDVIWEMLGDSSFFNATSLCEHHRILVRKLKDIRMAHSRREGAKQYLETCELELAKFKRDVNEEFARKVDGKDAENFKKVETKLKKKYEPKLFVLKENVLNAKNDFLEAEKILKEIQS
jgi:hypothetical protein